MDSYVNIEIRENPDFKSTTLMNTLFEKLHFALVKAGPNIQVGVSFPSASHGKHSSLGHVLRLHGQSSTLSEFMKSRWASSLGDYVSVTNVMPVPLPSNVRHTCVKRVQFQSNAERLRRRFMKRHNVDADIARQKIPDSVERRTNLPWLQLKSASTGQYFRLFIEIGESQASGTTGEFNRYGLSSTGTVPIF